MKIVTILLLSCHVFLLTSRSNAQSVGDEAPGFTLDLLDGGSFTLSDHSGKVVFIFLFGYNCPHCKSNGPNTQNDIYEVYKDNNEFVAVGVDTWDGNASGVTSFKETTGITYPLCLKGSSLEDKYETTYDRIIVVDKDGIIRFKSTADATSDVVAEASDVISAYLDSSSSDDDMEDDPDKDNMDHDTITAINNPEEFDNSFKLYPVPAVNYLTIESPYLKQKDINVKVFDMTGQNVFETRIVPNVSGQIAIPVNKHQAGLHILQVSTLETTFIRKFLIKN